MSNIEAVFKKKKAEGHKVFIPFITAGDPYMAATEKFIYALEEAGSDIIELGIPFSDPVADGPVIQRANLRAMANGVHIDKVFNLVETVRKNTQVPLVFLLYANIIYHYGIEKFFYKCQEVGVDGIIVPDVPQEEKEEFDYFARKYHIDFISLVAPTSKTRTKTIVQDATGFLYCVSSLGVTGTREDIQTDLEAMFEEIRKYCLVPTALGFGISNKEQAREIKDYADGVIVGSAIVKIVEEYGDQAEEELIKFVSGIREALK